MTRTRYTRRGSRRDRGYALLAALWLTVALSALGTVAALAARDALTASANRTALLRAGWHAQGCAERALAVLDDVFEAERGRVDGVVERWRSLDATLADAVPPSSWAPCAIRLRPVGDRLDLNAVDAASFSVLLRAVGVPGRRAEALARAFADWRAGVDSTGAALRTRDGSRAVGPRRLAALAELHDVPGFDSATIAVVAPAADVEPGRLSLAHAPAAALAALPGFGAEVVASVLDRRGRGLPLDLALVASDVSPAAARALGLAADALAQRATVDPDAWLLVVSAVDARGTVAAADTESRRTTLGVVRATLALRLARAGTHVVVTRRRRTW